MVEEKSDKKEVGRKSVASKKESLKSTEVKEDSKAVEASLESKPEIKEEKAPEIAILEEPAKEIIKETTPVETITIKKDTLWKYSTFILLAIIIIGAYIWYNGNTGGLTGQAIGATGEDGSGTLPSEVQIKTEGYPVEGEINVPVTIVEYSDFQCPFCERFYTQTLPKIKKEYIDTGKVKLIFKDFPLSFHQFAQKAAEATHCVREQKGDEGYWAMHDKIFENQLSLSIENLKVWAGQVGADSVKFNDCLGSGKMAGIVQKAFNEGRQDGVQGTPAFFVNGKLLSGAQPFEVFKSNIDAEL